MNLVVPSFFSIAAATGSGQLNIVLALLIQISIVIALSRVMGLLFKKINQPLVIGEIVAGIMLGPSLFGLLFPELSALLFPTETLPYLNILAQIGLIFFMFLVGLEFNSDNLKGKGDAAVIVSHVSIIAPFFLGSLLAIYLYPSLSTSAVPFVSFSLFMGAAMSVTAFPVLARILTERNLHKTYLGTIAITCAAVDDVTAWCLLAFVISVVRSGDMVSAIPTTLLAIVYIGFMLTVGRSVLNRLADYVEKSNNQKLSQLMVAVIYLGLLGSAMISEVIGIHTIFGAFLYGAVMPQRNIFVKDLAEKTEDFTLVFLLPIFFTYTGLRTQIGLLNEPSLWLDCVLVILMATMGKFGGSLFAAKLSGLSWRESSALAVLMNTRGLMELIILNIGLDLGVISPALFAMMVIMALVTTFVTSPVLEWIYPLRMFSEGQTAPTDTEAPQDPTPSYSIVVPLANPSSQDGLLTMALALALPQQQQTRIYPVHLVQLGDAYSFGSQPDQADKLVKEDQQRLQELVNSLKAPPGTLQPLSMISDDISHDLCRVAEAQQANLVLLGWHRPVLTHDFFGGKVRRIMETATTDVAVFIDRGLSLSANSKLAVLYSGTIHDRSALELALRLVSGQRAKLEILHTVELSRETRDLIALFREHLTIECTELTQDPIASLVEASRSIDLILLGTSAQWGLERYVFGQVTDELIVRCHSSLMIVKHHRQVTHLNALVVNAESSASLTLKS